MKNKLTTYKQKGKTINGKYLAQIDVGEDSQIIIISEKLKDRNDLFDKIKKAIK